MNQIDRSGTPLHWMRLDLHIHTPASEDYEDSGVSYLDILQEAERRELNMIAFTDHNTVHGFEQFRNELDFLRRLVEFDRCTPEERERLAEYERLLNVVTVLPGFEFTSHYGAHVLGIFDVDTPISVLEAVLLQLGITPHLIKAGSCAIPNTRHVTEAYEIIARNGGLVIAPHINGNTGVVMETLRMNASGQARVAATQNPHLHALEFVNFHTTHERLLSPSFYNGQQEHYSRQMFCLQGSDAHCLQRQTEQGTEHRSHGIGDRYFEALLAAPTFAALRDLLEGQDFGRVRVPKRDQKEWEVDHLRTNGDSNHQLLRIASEDYLKTVWQDIAALANADGGVLVLMPDADNPFDPAFITNHLRETVAQELQNPPELGLELLPYERRELLRVEVKTLASPPYLTLDGKIYVRRELETVVANRDEVLQLARRALAAGVLSPLDNGEDLDLPRSGVEIVGEQKRGGIWSYEVRDLRTTTGVERDRAQGLWAYAISRHEDLREGTVDLNHQVRWYGRLGVWRLFQQGNRTKYDLVHRDANGVVDHVFYGVSDWGLSESWQHVIRMYSPTAELGSEIPTEEPLPLDEELSLDEPPQVWGDRRYRWKNRGGVWRIQGTGDDVHFDLVMRDHDTDEIKHFNDVPKLKLKPSWLPMILVDPPTTGIEVVEISEDERGGRLFRFKNLRTNETSDNWRADDLEQGTVREYAARMFLSDIPLDDAQVRWWGNIGYMRPMRSQVDLVYRDPDGIDHIYYAARRDELEGIWGELLQQWPDE